MALISVTCLLTFVFENSRSPACPVCCNLTQEGSHGNLHFRSAELASGKITPLDVLATTWAGREGESSLASAAAFHL